MAAMFLFSFVQNARTPSALGVSALDDYAQNPPTYKTIPVHDHLPTSITIDDFTTVTSSLLNLCYIMYASSSHKTEVDSR